MKATETTKPIRALEGLRGLAILLVLLLHAKHRLTNSSVEFEVLELGWIGVDIFFVLSGFLITRSLLQLKQRRGFFGCLREFWCKRVLRIFPIYYLFLFLGFTVTPLHFNLDAPEYSQLLRLNAYFWLYLQNTIYLRYEWLPCQAWVGHLWSLAVEEQLD